MGKRQKTRKGKITQGSYGKQDQKIFEICNPCKSRKPKKEVALKHGKPEKDREIKSEKWWKKAKTTRTEE